MPPKPLKKSIDLDQRRDHAQSLRLWEHASGKHTGPRTPEGRLAVSRNAWKGGHRQMVRELSRLVGAEIRQARDLVNRTALT